jgi:hypothetical protein
MDTRIAMFRTVNVGELSKQFGGLRTEELT